MNAQLSHRGGSHGNRFRVAIWSLVAALWLLPVIAMRFTTEMNWSVFDFVFWALMLGAAGGAYEIATRMSRSSAYRAGFGIAIVGAFALVWISLAVGIIGDEDDPANLVFAAVLLTGLIGAAVARLQPQGMAHALVAVAIVQALAVPVAAIAGSSEGAVLSACFVALWLGAAQMFRIAARQSAATA
ncbi:MAG: hypothetical protein IPP28_02670 [Xanthomonadales bacterium]|nr:hypothetical protein [Xanthomonadales bacterium]